MRQTMFTAAVFAGLATSGCVNHNMSETEAFFAHPALEIRVGLLASGLNYWYDIWGSQIRVIADDSTAQLPKVLYDKHLTEEQQATLRKCISELPLRTLKGWYETPGIIDGIFIEFRIPDGRNAQRIIRISNYYQADLMRLAACVDSLLPEKLRIDYREHDEVIASATLSDSRADKDGLGRRPGRRQQVHNRGTLYQFLLDGSCLVAVRVRYASRNEYCVPLITSWCLTSIE